MVSGWFNFCATEFGAILQKHDSKHALNTRCQETTWQIYTRDGSFDWSAPPFPV